MAPHLQSPQSATTPRILTLKLPPRLQIKSILSKNDTFHALEIKKICGNPFFCIQKILFRVININLKTKKDRIRYDQICAS